METREYLTQEDELILCVKRLLKLAMKTDSHRVIIGERDKKTGEWKKAVYQITVEKINVVQPSLLI